MDEEKERQERERQEREREEKMILELCRKTNDYVNDHAQNNQHQFNMYQKIKSTQNTRLCESVFTNQTCRHGSKCNFAHSVEQLKKSYCNHGEYCNYIKRKDATTYCNNCTRPCKYFHPNESNLSYANRLGIKSKQDNIYKVPEDIFEDVINIFILKGIKTFSLYCMKEDDNVIKIPNSILTETIELLRKKAYTKFNIDCV
jgi:hypothetical protein